MTQADLEERDNWQATFYLPRARKYDCLMRTARPGGFYMHQPDYQGIFSWGATMTANLDWLRQSLADGHAVLVEGNLPAESAHLHTCPFCQYDYECYEDDCEPGQRGACPTCSQGLPSKREANDTQ